MAKKLAELKDVVYAELVENEQARRSDTELLLGVFKRLGINTQEAQTDGEHYPLPSQVATGAPRIESGAHCDAQERKTAGIQRLCESGGGIGYDGGNGYRFTVRLRQL